DLEGTSVRRTRRRRVVAVRHRGERLPRPPPARAPRLRRPARGRRRAAGPGRGHRGDARLRGAAPGGSRGPGRSVGGAARGPRAGPVSRDALRGDRPDPGNLGGCRQDTNLPRRRDPEGALWRGRTLMDCRDVTQLAVERLTGEADAEARAALAEHLASCERCREEMAARAGIWARLGADPDATIRP